MNNNVDTALHDYWNDRMLRFYRRKREMLDSLYTAGERFSDPKHTARYEAVRLLHLDAYDCLMSVSGYFVKRD